MLKTQYAGLELKNPIIAASSGLTDNVEKIVALEKAGVGAVVLKSLFEEQLAAQSEHLLNSSDSDYPEAYDYLQNIVKAHEVEKYLTLIREARKAVSIPVIASINCYDDGSWESFAADLEKAGASAIELNVQKINPTTEYRPGTIGKLHVEILQKVEAAVHIPVTVKISRNLSNLVSVVLFNRSWQPDIDIHNRRLVAGSPFSTSADLSDTLRWLGIVSGQVNKLPLAASTGVHTPEDLVKVILAGASAAELCSTLYLNGETVVGQMLDFLTGWLKEQGFSSLKEAVGALNYKNIPDVAYYERLQFIRQYREVGNNR